MTISRRTLPGLAAALVLGFASLGAQAMGGDHPGRHGDPAKMQERHAQHLASLKTKLKLSADQESAWTTFAAAMAPGKRPVRPDPAEMQKLTTPERLDRMQALMNERHAAMGRRADATKAFYATLSAEQKTIFDAHAMPHRERGQGPRRH